MRWNDIGKMLSCLGRQSNYAWQMQIIYMEWLQNVASRHLW